MWSSFFPSPQRPMTLDFEGFLSQILSVTFLSYVNSWERARVRVFPLFNGECQSRELLVPSLVNSTMYSFFVKHFWKLLKIICIYFLVQIDMMSFTCVFSIPVLTKLVGAFPFKIVFTFRVWKIKIIIIL